MAAILSGSESADGADDLTDVCSLPHTAYCSMSLVPETKLPFGLELNSSADIDSFSGVVGDSARAVALLADSDWLCIMLALAADDDCSLAETVHSDSGTGSGKTAPGLLY
ncbi:MAG: hypothetical protein OXE78_11955 [Gammaproteobacteria bacterium]|nr:hypothetical protein [Gammaproteobacteria bacterium]